jgi:hypothetical protein
LKERRIQPALLAQEAGGNVNEDAILRILAHSP